MFLKLGYIIHDILQIQNVKNKKILNCGATKFFLSFSSFNQKMPDKKYFCNEIFEGSKKFTVLIFSSLWLGVNAEIISASYISIL